MDCFLSFLSQYWLFAWYILTCRTLSHPEDYLFSSVYTISYPFSFLSPFIDIWSKPPLSTAPFLQDPSILFSSLQYWNYSLCGLIISNCQIYVLSLHSLWVLHHLNACEYFLPFFVFSSLPICYFILPSWLCYFASNFIFLCWCLFVLLTTS